MTDAAPSPTDRFSSTLEGMRAAIAAEGTSNGLTGKLLAAILGLLDTLMALLADLRAGRLAAPGPGAACAASTACAASAEPRLSPARRTSPSPRCGEGRGEVNAPAPSLPFAPSPAKRGRAGVAAAGASNSSSTAGQPVRSGLESKIPG